MAKYVNLSKAHKREIRRLTLKANRRIRTAEKQYRQSGLEILPRDVVGKSELQTKDRWHTPKTPLSSSTKFKSQEQFEEHMSFLKSFDEDRPTIAEYGKQQRIRTISAVESTIGYKTAEDFQERINSMTSAETDLFWREFGKKANQLGIQYDSEQVLRETMSEFFPEDIQNLLEK